MGNPESEYPSLEESKRILRESRAEDYDGHTSFAELDTEGRIRWASRAAQMIHWARRQRDGGV